MLQKSLTVLKFLIANAPKAAALEPTVGAAITAGLELYREIRDTTAAPPDALTDAQLAQLLQDEGLAIQVEADHWLAQYGFAA